MNSKYFLSIGTVLLFVLNACKTDVDIMAPYKEQAVVFGLLDVSEPVQYIKINRVFGGAGNAYDMAQNPDSLNFNPMDMKITLERLDNGLSKESILLHDTILPQIATEGTFSKAKNILYYTAAKLQSQFEYKLSITNNKTGYKAEATTPLVAAIRTREDNYDTINPTAPQTIKFINNGKPTDITYEYLSSKNGKIYQTTLRFYYSETNDAGTTVNKSIDWILSPVTAANTNGEETMETKIKGEDFYQYLQSVKTTYFNNMLKREAIGCRYFTTVAGEVFQVYKDLNAPASSNFQEKPLFTNVTNGVGILSTRSTKYSALKILGKESEDKLIESGLGFQ